MRDTMRLHYCSEADVQKMHEATLDILEKTGIKSTSDKFISFCKEAGLNVSDDISGKGSRIRFPRDVVEKALRDAGKGKDMSALGLLNKMQHVAAKLMPQSFVMNVWLRRQKL